MGFREVSVHFRAKDFARVFHQHGHGIVGFVNGRRKQHRSWRDWSRGNGRDLRDLGQRPNAASAIVQLPGQALKMKLTALNNEFTKPGKLQSLLMRHMYLLHFQVARSVLCNRFHHVESRLSMVVDEPGAHRFR